MKPTNEQIIAEAHRRFVEEQRNHDGLTTEGSSFSDHIIEVMRENWTPPEPVDPDLLAFREWAAHRARVIGGETDWASAYRQGRFDHTDYAQAYLAGARMAAERERERARLLVEYIEADERRLDGVAHRQARDSLAKYRGEA